MKSRLLAAGIVFAAVWFLLRTRTVPRRAKFHVVDHDPMMFI